MVYLKRKSILFGIKKKIHAELLLMEIKKHQENPELLPHERVIDWIAKFDNDSYYADENVSTEEMGT